MDHKSDDQLAQEMKEALTKVQIGGHYTHYKSPDSLYEVKELVLLEADDSICVIYKSLRIKSKPIFVRPLSEWLEQVEWQDKTVPRFKKV